jgi:hypothetical protein
MIEVPVIQIKAILRFNCDEPGYLEIRIKCSMEHDLLSTLGFHHEI